MFNSSTGSELNLIFLAVVFTWTVAGSFYASYRRKNRGHDLPDSPVLLTYYTDGNNLHPIKEGFFGDLRYSTFLASNLSMRKGSPEAALLYRVELPFTTTIHLVGIPKKTGAVQLDPTRGKSIMERVDLEGDFSTYFNLFCEKGMQQTARYVLDPKAMVFALDFCQSQNWEIVGNELYFVIASGMRQDPGDATSLHEDIKTFVAEIKPAIGRPLTDKQKAALAPYGKDRRVDLACPLCQSILTNENHYFKCPKGEGVLLTGKQLRNVKKGLLTLPDTRSSLPPRTSSTINCPSCHTTMNRVPYSGSDTIIDSCPDCPYRWLDAGEYKPLPVLT